MQFEVNQLKNGVQRFFALIGTQQLKRKNRSCSTILKLEDRFTAVLFKFSENIGEWRYSVPRSPTWSELWSKAIKKSRPGSSPDVKREVPKCPQNTCELDTLFSVELERGIVSSQKYYVSPHMDKMFLGGNTIMCRQKHLAICVKFWIYTSKIK